MNVFSTRSCLNISLVLEMNQNSTPQSLKSRAKRAVLVLHDNVIDFDTFENTNNASSVVLLCRCCGKPFTKYT